MKHGLGKGILALVDENEILKNDSNNLVYIKIDNIIPNRSQPRKTFDENLLLELAESIKEKGIIQPIIVTELGENKYELIAGERRWRAAKIAGLDEIPAIIKNVNEEEKLELALIENIQREDLNPIEEALAYKEILEKTNINQEDLAKRIGKNRSSIANTLRLLKLPDYIQNKIINGELFEGHARAILMLENIDNMIEFTDLIIKKNLSVREAEKLAKNFEKQKNVSRETPKIKDSILYEIEENLIKVLGTKVSISGTINTGKIEIFFNSKDELENIYNILKNKNS